MSAQPIGEYMPDPDDPVEILRVLPEKHHEIFWAEYKAAAMDVARHHEGYMRLRRLLRLWRLRAIAYSDPRFEEDLNAIVEGRFEDLNSVPAEELIPDWPPR